MFSVSVDSIHVHKSWVDNELKNMVDGGIPYPMLSDPGGKIGNAFGVYNEIEGEEYRSRFIIDPDGLVQSYEVICSDVGRSEEETIRQIKALQKVWESNKTEVTPSGWEKGKKTLKPGEDLVGNVWKEWNPKD